MNGTTLGVKIDADLRRRLKSLARARRRSAHWLAREAIQRYVETEEDAERVKRETIERWERYQATADHAEDEAVMAWLDTWGTVRERGWRRRRG